MSNQLGSQPEAPKPPQPRGFNWQALVGVCVLLVVLGMVFTTNATLSTLDLSYPSFVTMRDQDRIVRNDKKYPLQLETSDVPNNAVISGFLKPAQIAPTDAKYDTYRFHVTLLAKDAEEIRGLLGNDLLVVLPTQMPSDTESREISYSEFRYAWAQREIDVSAGAAQKLRLVVGPNGTYLLFGTRKAVLNRVAMTDPKTGNALAMQPFRVKASTALQREQLAALVNDWNVGYAPNSDWLRSAIFAYILPLLLVGLLMFFLFRQQMRSAGKGAMSFGKSKARLLMIDKNRVTFRDVAGIQEAKEELYEIVDFLSNPQKFQSLGASIPKGVLMVGPPGTGKTLLARAIAGEANVPFFSISGSDFVEMFVGVGASRVRDMFEQGRKNAPCLIFIDEIDAVGRHRGHGLGGGHDEREQTLNQLLVEMDGFDSQEGVIIIAATNRPDVLDPALLRPGRFDRRVTVSLPDVNGREEILKVHAKKIKIQAGVDLGVIARGTPGFSGAELANLLNEAALHAARKGLKEVTLEEMEEARDKIRWGRERRSMAMTEHEKTTTAWHEAGHAYLNVVLDHTHPLHKVTIIPRGPYLGATMFLPERDSISMQRREALSNLIMTMGGRIAEEFYSNDISNGASGDIRQATALARKMVCEWGMSEKLGMVEYSEGDGEVFLARDISRPRNYSDETARVIDGEVKLLIDRAYAEAVRLLTEGREKVQLVAEALVKYETLDGAQIEELIANGFLANPPKMNQPPSLPTDVKPSEPKRDREDKPEDGTPIPILVEGVPTT